MDFHNLKRRELQELCKKHEIPANLTNLEMAVKLTALLVKPFTRGRRRCLKGSEENASEIESEFENRPAKRFRFSPQSEMFEFEKSVDKCMETRSRARRKSFTIQKKGVEVVEIGSPVIFMDGGVGSRTRSGRQKLMEGSHVKGMEGKMEKKGNISKGKLPSASGFFAGMSSNTVVDEGAGRVTRSRMVKLMEHSEVENKGFEVGENEMIEKSGAKCMETKGRGRRKSVVNQSKGGEVVGNSSPVTLVDEGVVRITRSRRGKVMEDSHVKSKGGKMGMQGSNLKDTLSSARGVVGISRNALMDEGAGRVTRSRLVQSVEDSEVENKGGKKQIKDRRVTRSRKVKLMEDREVESKRGKMGMKADAVQGELPSAAADNLPVVDSSNEEQVAQKRSLRNRVVDVEKKKTTSVEVSCRQNEQHTVMRKRSLRTIELKGKRARDYVVVVKGSKRRGRRAAKDMGSKDIVRTIAAEEESGVIQAEKVLRRSRRHVADVEYQKVVKRYFRKNEKAVQQRLRSIVAVEAKEVSEVDNVSGSMLEASPVENNLRRSKRGTAEPDVLITRERTDEVANANYNEETKKRKRDAVRHEKAVKVDGNSVERLLRRTTQNTGKSEEVVAKDKEETQKRRRVATLQEKAVEVDGNSVERPHGRTTQNPGKSEEVVANDKEETKKRRRVVVLQEKAVKVDSNSVERPFRRSTRNTGKSEEVAANEKEETKKRRRDAICQEKAAEGDGNSVERPLRQSKRISKKIERVAAATVRPKVVKRQMRKSKKTRQKFDDSFNEEILISDDLAAPEADVIISEIAEDKKIDNFDSVVAESIEHFKFERADASEPREEKGGETCNNENSKEGNGSEQVLYMRETPETVENDGLAGPSISLDVSLIGATEDVNEPAGMSRSMIPETYSISFWECPDEQQVRECIDEERGLLNLEVSNFHDHENCPPAVSEERLNFKVARESLDSMDLETHLEPKAQSPTPSELWMCVEDKSIEGGDNLVESSNFEEIEHSKQKDDAALDGSLSTELESVSRNTLAVLPDQGVTNDEEPAMTSDTEGVVSFVQGEDTPISDGGKCTEINLSARRCRSLSAIIANSSSILRHQSAIANTGSKPPLVAVDDAQNVGYGASSEMEKKEKSFYMNDLKMSPRTGLDNFQRCNFPLDGNASRVIDASYDEVDPVAEELEPKGNFEADTECLHENCNGQDSRAINLEKTNDIELENSHNPLAISEGESTRLMNSEETLKQKDESSNKEGNSCEAHSQFPLETFLAHVEMTYCEFGNSDGDGRLKSSCDSPEKCQDSVPDASRGNSEEMLEDDNVCSCETSVLPSDLRAKVVDSSPISTTAVETEHNFDESIIRVPKGSFTDKVSSEKQLEIRRESPSQQRKEVDGGLAVEAFTALADGQNRIEVAKFEDGGLLKDQEVACNYDLQIADLGSSAGSKLSCTMDIALSNAEDINETANFHFVAEPCVALEDRQNSVVAAFEESGRSRNLDACLNDCMQNAQFNPFAVSTFSFNQNQDVPSADTVEKVDSTSKDGNSEGCDLSACGTTRGVVNALNVELGSTKDVELGSVTESMVANMNHVLCSEADTGGENLESYPEEEFGPFNLETTNEPESIHPFAAALEGQKPALTNETDSFSNTREEKNTSSTEKKVKHDFFSLEKISSPGRDGGSGQSDRVLSGEEQEKDISSYEVLVDAETAVECETQSTNQQNIFPNAAEGIPDGDELKMLFGSSITSHKVLCLEQQGNSALDTSGSGITSVEFRDGLVLSDSTPLQHDDQRIGESGIPKENETWKDNHAESGAEVAVFSSFEMNKLPRESKGNQGFPLVQNRDFEDEIGTSEAAFVSEQVTMPGFDAEYKVGELVIQDSVASESSKSHELFKDSDVDTMVDFFNSESTEHVSPIISNPEKESASTEIAELTLLFEPPAESVQKTVNSNSKGNIVAAEEQEHGVEREEPSDQSLEDDAGDAAADKSIKQTSKPWMSTFNMKDRRTILIHGTPNQLQKQVDRKENELNSKMEKVGTWTTVKPVAKRPALKDLLRK